MEQDKTLLKESIRHLLEEERKRKEEFINPTRPKPEPWHMVRYVPLVHGRVEDFLKDEEAVQFAPHLQIGSNALYDVYESWCRKMKKPPIEKRSFFLFLKEHSEEYRIRSVYHITLPDSGRVRGYRGIAAAGTDIQKNTGEYTDV